MIFEVRDASRRRIRMTEKQFSHIINEHPEMMNKLEHIKDVLLWPDKIIKSPRDETARYYFRHEKNRKVFLIVVVKYLNGDGFVITAFISTKVVI
jgi:hypothetical protein